MSSASVSSHLLEKLKSRILEVPVTPLVRLEDDIYLKLETCQKTGSVKDRFVFEEVKRGLNYVLHPPAGPDDSVDMP